MVQYILSIVQYIFIFEPLNLIVQKSLTKYRDILSKPRQALVAIVFLCADSLSTNFFLMKTDRYNRFAYRTFNFNNALYSSWISIKQSFIFTTWTSHMHFLHSFSPPVKKASQKGCQTDHWYFTSIIPLHCSVTWYLS